mmetsp:Transcript_10432/g.28509  ORF Transcript_10432/g.28509 Transcript_10432/m.28509 type:complete len:84 (-) Transcript_10432:875-1126(-)
MGRQLQLSYSQVQVAAKGKDGGGAGTGPDSVSSSLSHYQGISLETQLQPGRVCRQGSYPARQGKPSSKHGLLCPPHDNPHGHQ